MNGSPEPIFLDYNAGAPPDPRVLDAMRRLPPEAHANPASPHSFGRRARAVLEDARERIAAALGLEALEVTFVSGGTEANNLALHSGLQWAAAARAPVLRSRLEHPSVAVPLDRKAAELGLEVFDLEIDAAGIQRLPAGFTSAAFLSLIYGQNEVGVVQDGVELARRLRAAGGLVHRDASQALGRLELAAVVAEADYLTLSPHKAGGPKGIGILVVHEGRPFTPLLRGGEQEYGRRPGTVSAVLAHGAAVAVELAVRERELRAARMHSACEAFLAGLRDEDVRVVPDGAPRRLPNTLCLCFEAAPARELLPALDAAGVALSFGNACSSGALAPSPVLGALGLSDEEAGRCLRVSLGPELSVARAREAAARVAQVLARIRRCHR